MSQFRKNISVIYIFVLLAELPGCVSSGKFIQINDIPVKDVHPSQNSYIIYGRRSDHFPKNKTYIVKNISISDGYLIADRDKGTNKPWTCYTIFVRSDSLIKVAPDKSVKIALNDICNVKVEEINWFRFWVYTSVAILSFAVLMISIYGNAD
jgi:hypothetical protein